MESQSLLSAFCSNSTFSPIHNPKPPVFPISPSSSSSSFSSWIIVSKQFSPKTPYLLLSKIVSPKNKILFRNSLRKIKAVSGNGEEKANGVRKKKLAVFVSGGGSGFQSIHEAILRGTVHGDIVVLVTDKPGCGGAEYAREHSIPVIFYPKLKDKPESVSASDLLTTLRKYEVDFILLAGFLKLIPVALVQAYPRSIINIHPSLLPAFGGKGYYGMKVHQAVIASGARYSGPTIHFVDEHYDTGRILAQRVVPVLANDTAAELAARVLQKEHQLYVEVAAALCEERIIWREDGVPLIRSKGNPNDFS
ncbi:Phosphoribosylglycinamide formyltransferase [Bertholletia excelsa]